MLGVAIIYFLFLYIDIRLHVSKAKKVIKERERRQVMYIEHIANLNVSTLNKNQHFFLLNNKNVFTARHRK